MSRTQTEAEPEDSSGIGGIQQSRRSGRIWEVTFSVIGSTLIVASLLKVWQTYTDPISALASTRFSPTAFYLLIIVEILTGAWCLLGKHRTIRALWIAAMFAAFLVFNLIKVSNGETSCDCFGTLIVPIWVSLLIDAFALISALASLRFAQSQMPLKTKRGVVLGGALLALLLVASTASVYLNLSVVQVSGIHTNGESQVVYLRPRDWQGEPFPLLEVLDGESPLTTGNWTIMLYKESCSTCQRHIEEALQSKSQFAFIALPPDDGSAFSDQGDPEHLFFAINDDRRWYLDVPLPAIIHLEDGTVDSVQR